MEQKRYIYLKIRPIKYILFFISALITHTLKGQIVNLPVFKTTDEQLKEFTYKPPTPKGITHPPVSPIRNAAEWEEMQGVLISWKSGYETFLSEIVKYAQEEATVYIFCNDSNTVKNYLTSHSISTTNTRYIVASLNSVWIRDYGPNNIYVNDVDSLYLVDWVYNRPRPQDDASPKQFATLMQLPLYQCTQPPTDLVATGGNWVSDGFGTAFSSKLILTKNATTSSYNQTPKLETDIDNIVHDYLGIERYIKMDVVPYDGIHHIDMHFKLLDEETLLVGQYPNGISDGHQIEDWKFRVYNPTAVKELNPDNFICTVSYQSEQLILNIFSSTEIDANISLINNLGQPIKILYKGKLLQGYQELTDNVHLAKGLYFVNIETSKGKKVVKLAIN